MMYFVVDENNIITNVIVCDEELASKYGYKPEIEGLWIGDEYKPIDPSEIVSTYMEVKDNVITKIVEATAKEAAANGLYPYIFGKRVGDYYITPTNDELAEENKLLKAQVNATNDYMDFLEECLVEMAGIVYG